MSSSKKSPAASPQLGLFGRKVSKEDFEIIVEGKEPGRLFKVDRVSWTCSCKHEQCFHLSWAIDVVKNGGMNSKFEMVSAMHKEIRRGDTAAALYWADLLALHHASYVKQYIPTIVFEETRDIGLMLMCIERKDADYGTLVTHIAAARKKWESKGCYRVMFAQLKAWVNANDVWPVSKRLAYVKRGLEKDDLDTFMQGYQQMFCYPPDDLVNAYWRPFDEIVSRAAADRTGDDRFNELFRNFHRSSWRPAWEDFRNTIAEAAMGFWEPGFDEEVHPKPVHHLVADGSVLRRVPVYTYDQHTSKGKSRLRQHWKDVAPGRPMPDGLDLRWSGAMSGIAWRYLAFEKFGMDYIEKPWESVSIDSKAWMAIREYVDT